MELIKGVPITQYCDGKQLTPRERLELFMPVCQALQHAHQKGIIHRDIKPSNVLVAKYDDRPVPKVIDFGVVKATLQHLTEKTMFTQFGQIVGTVDYMSPEQADLNQLDIDTRSDVYSLGVLLYELLTGETPFNRQRLRSAAFDELLRIIREEEPPKPSLRLSTSESLPSIAANRHTEPKKLSTLVRGELDWIVMKALEKDRSRRYETANGFANDIQRYLNDEAVVACPPSVAYLFKKFVRRNKVLLVTLGAISAILLAASVISTWSAIRATRAERLATDRLTEVEQQRNEKELARQEAEAKEQEAKLARDDAKWNLYVARMYPMVDAWQRQEYGHLERMLEETRPKEAEPDFRGWEWSYFMDQCNQAYFTIEGEHPAWHPKEPELAIVKDATEGSHVEVWSPHTRRRVRTIPIPGHKHLTEPDEIIGLKWTGNGTQLACGWRSGRVIFLDRQTGEVPFEHSRTEEDMRSFDVSRDGKLLVTTNRDGGIEVWDVATGESTRVLVEQQRRTRKSLLSVALNEDSNCLVAQQRWEPFWATWNVQTGESFEYSSSFSFDTSGWPEWNASGNRFTVTSKHSFAIYEPNRAEPLESISHDDVKRVIWIGDGRVVSSGGDHTIRIWDAHDFSLLSEWRLHTSPITDLDVSADARFLASSSEGSVRVSRLDWSPKQAASLNPKEPRDGDYHFVAWESNGRYLASGYIEPHGFNAFLSPLNIWDAKSEQIVQQGHIGIIRSLGWRPDQKSIWASSNRGRIHQLDLGTGNLETLTRISNRNPCSISSHSPDGKWLAMCPGKQVKIINTQSLEVIKEIDTSEWVGTLRRSHDSQRIALGAWSDIIVWAPFSGDKTEVDNKVVLTSITWDPTDRTIALGRRDGAIHVVKADTLETIALLRGHTGEVQGIDWAENGRRIASAGLDGTMKIWDAATGHQLISLPHVDGHGFLAAAWSPDSRRLAGGDLKGGVLVWGSEQIKPLPPTAKGLATGQEMLRLQGHTDDEYSAVFNPDGARIVSGSGEDTVKVWDATTGQETLSLQGHTGSVLSMAFSPDGTPVATSGYIFY